MDEAVVVSCVAYVAICVTTTGPPATSWRFLRPIGIETSWPIAPLGAGGDGPDPAFGAALPRGGAEFILPDRRNINSPSLLWTHLKRTEISTC
jgi:hypothetical protein